VRFFIWIGTEQPWQEMAETARFAEATGWDGIYLADHFMPNEQPAGLGPRLEAWTALSAIAAITERVHLGILVTGNTYRHPAILAKMAATTDRISDGRLVLGLGAGWQVSEHEAYGIDLYEVPERLHRLDEACEVIRLLTTQERSDFEGRYYQLADAPCEPKPVQSPLPLLIGTSGEKVGMRIAARRAHVWNCWGTPETMAHKLAVLDEHCAAIGRDPKSIERSTQALVRMSNDPEKLARWRAEPAMPSIIGTPAAIAAELASYDRLGIDEFVVSDRILGRDLAERHDKMQLFLGEAAKDLRVK
jgi:F420-dependent oxidoreductase-like protein